MYEREKQKGPVESPFRFVFRCFLFEQRVEEGIERRIFARHHLNNLAFRVDKRSAGQV